MNSIDTGFQLRLFLERFGIRTALLNSELPLNSRHHILQEFNKSLFDYLIATDDVYAGTDKREGKAAAQESKGNKGKGKKGKDAKGVRAGGPSPLLSSPLQPRPDAAMSPPNSNPPIYETPLMTAPVLVPLTDDPSSLHPNTQGAAAKDEEFGVTRGVDFRGVNTVINFEMPNSKEGYVHRCRRCPELLKGDSPAPGPSPGPSTSSSPA